MTMNISPKATMVLKDLKKPIAYMAILLFIAIFAAKLFNLDRFFITEVMSSSYHIYRAVVGAFTHYSFFGFVIISLAICALLAVIIRSFIETVVSPKYIYHDCTDIKHIDVPVIENQEQVFEYMGLSEKLFKKGVKRVDPALLSQYGIDSNGNKLKGYHHPEYKAARYASGA